MDFRFPLKKSSNLANPQIQKDNDSEFIKAKNLFIAQRKKCGISLEDLSRNTKISRNVLIAIESGWEKYLPESTYLNSMLKRLESELKLEIGSLNGLSNKKNIIKIQPKFRFINIDFLNSWIGSLFYFILMLLSILAINSQQKYLLEINSLSTKPVLLEDINIDDESIVDNQ